MNANNIESKFAAMGARIKVREVASRWRQGARAWISPADFAVDIRRDGNGEFFELRVPTHLSETLDVSVMQADPRAARPDLCRVTEHLIADNFRRLRRIKRPKNQCCQIGGYKAATRGIGARGNNDHCPPATGECRTVVLSDRRICLPDRLNRA